MPIAHTVAAPSMYFRIVRRFCTLRLSCGSEGQADGSVEYFGRMFKMFSDLRLKN